MSGKRQQLVLTYFIFEDENQKKIAMKKSLLAFPIFIFLVFVLASYGNGHHQDEHLGVKDGGNGFAVAELFTSEGCSSCPSADEAIAEISKKYKGIYVLCFHVDYWNYLGWKDEFSSATYTQRQSKYAELFNLNSIYTPQVIINAKTQFVGSDRNKLQHSIDEALLQNSSNSIVLLSAKASDNQQVVIKYKTADPVNDIVSVALVQLHAANSIKRGENQGKLLEHINIVRDFKTIPGEDGSIVLTMPAGLSAKECKVIAFVQNKSTTKVSGANECAIL